MNSASKKKEWVIVVVIIAIIYSSIFFSGKVLTLLTSLQQAAVLFVAGMCLVAAAIISYALQKNRGFLSWLGIIIISGLAVMLFLRLNAPERSHMIEYSLLTIALLRAIARPYNENRKPINSYLVAGAIAIFIGVMDEFIQYFVPSRVFDVQDILFNSLIVSSTLIAISLLKRWKSFLQK